MSFLKIWRDHGVSMRRWSDITNWETELIWVCFIELTWVLGALNHHVPRLKKAAAAICAAKSGMSMWCELKAGFALLLASIMLIITFI